VAGDLDEPESLAGLPTKGALAYYLAPPPGRGETDPRVRAFLGCIPPGEEPETTVYMSTTAVYGDLRGGWATEETPPAPSAARGMRRLDAENVLLAWGRQGGVPVVILRVAGIYGPGRLPVEKVREGAPVLAGSDSPFSNRIHSEDLARVCVAAARRGTGGAVYNVSDGQPGTIAQYYCAVADLLGVPRPPTMTMAKARRVMSQEMLSYLSESKRVDNRKMREELGVALLYPTLETGLAASLGGEE
jgi:nucleoside-diphosphate-sugar epimerase